jgi:hypothetical protein
MPLRPTHALAFAVALVALGIAAQPASARNAYRLQAIQQYKLTGMNCQYCHVAATGGSNWNKFGTALDAQYTGAAKRDIKQALYLVLKANKDSDGDGYPDVLEVVAKTLPGDAKSKPTKSVAALQADLQKLGGVDAFKAK